MKTKLLHGIVKDLMKFPIGEKKMPGASHSMPEHGKGGVSVTIHTGKPGMDEGEEEESLTPELSDEEGMEDPVMGKKSPMVEKAIHAKMKGKF